MPKLMYCWRCKMDIPMLEDVEWEQIAPFLADPIKQIKAYRLAHGVSLAEAKEKGYGQSALAVYEQLTGFHETNVNAIWHHRVSQYGPTCISCGKPLRTPEAKRCVYCGLARS